MIDGRAMDTRAGNGLETSLRATGVLWSLLSFLVHL